MELKDTVDLMLSEDWKDRLIAEYLQTKIRYNKVHKLIIQMEVSTVKFEVPIPIEDFKAQAQHMGMYLYELEKRAMRCGVELPAVES